MLQFYFLSVAANFLAGTALSADWISEKFAGLAPVLAALSERRARMIIGLAALLVGLGTLFVSADGRPIFGDLFPSAVGVVVGIALLFEVIRQETLFPGAEPSRVDGAGKAPRAWRTALGAFAYAAAILHFFLPERLIL
jgi:hypothetical protein